MANIGTYILEKINIIPNNIVEEHCAAFISDIIYKLFYSNNNQIRNLQSFGKISKEIVIDIILSIFEEEKKELLKLYTNISYANIRILDAYINKSKLIIEAEIEVSGKDNILIREPVSININ